MKKMKKLKKIKFHKKRLRNNKIVKINSIKLCLISLGIICIILILFFVIWKFAINKYLDKDRNNPEIAYYKGEKIEKMKILEEYLSRVPNNKRMVGNERFKILRNFNLTVYSNDPKIKNQLKSKYMNLFSRLKNKYINKIETFYVSYACPFGNSVIQINNLILICEIIGCNKIILKDHHTRKWLIKDPVYIKKLKISIMLGAHVNCSDDTIYCLDLGKWDPFYPGFVRPEIRILYLRDELLRNIPNINTDPEDLYIHIRGGDIFSSKPESSYYAQPPLCYYEKIINTIFHRVLPP